MVKVLISLLLLACNLASAQQPPSCSEQAKTDLERVYCQIKNQSPSTRLPNFHEFKSNPPKTQRLLLRRPAKKLGISLPKEQKASSKNNRKNKEKKKHVKKDKLAPTQASQTTQGLAAYCKMVESTISCDDMHYSLLNNLPNHKLTKDALNPSQAITLSVFSGDKSDQNEVMDYLKTAYTQYIQHMIAIGLAASTMSFTKFYHTFMEVESRKVSFSRRLSTMFEYLKKDKTSIGVRSRYNSLLPESLDNCASLTRDTIVCDNVKQNWVYQQVSQIR